ncbi:MAG TPA: hypothetical protein VFA02_10195 [Pseudacidobacterium sp.]|nr:hypothetical protein [Pseudacidobacterium sp.]
MPMHNDNLRKHSTSSGTHHANESRDMENSVREGYELTDVSVQGILVFLLALAVSLGVAFIFCFGMGKIVNNALVKHDGPPNKWTEMNYTGGGGKLRNMESNPALEQQQLKQLTQSFPTPRLQGDDGDRDTADLHAREDLLLENYSWVDRSKGTVRIPIERAMELIAQRGLPVEQKPQQALPLMTGDHPIEVTAPLTDGFARTAYEQEMRSANREPGEQASSNANNH